MCVYRGTFLPCGRAGTPNTPDPVLALTPALTAMDAFSAVTALNPTDGTADTTPVDVADVRHPPSLRAAVPATARLFVLTAAGPTQLIVDMVRTPGHIGD